MILAIMPCRGRAQQTVENVQALLKTAGGFIGWRLVLVIDNDQAAWDALNGAGLLDHEDVQAHWLHPPEHQHASGYWRCLQHATDYRYNTGIDLILNLANDLYPTEPGWLDRLYGAYRQRFGDGPGLMGLGGDGHGPGHSCHFLIHRKLLDRYGRWPTHYRHNYGDTELCQRAIEDGLYGKATRAVLEHRHPIRGTAQDDEVYRLGRQRLAEDEALFHQRRAAGWPPVGREVLV